MALAHGLPASLTPPLLERVAALVAHFEQVRTTRMVGVPLLNPALRVEAVGFQVAPAEAGFDGAEGVLITPWFMSLVRLPAQAQHHGQRVGQKQVRHFGAERFDFLSAHDPALGGHETCALFSPMNGFASHEQAHDTALAALALIRQPQPHPQPLAPVPAPPTPTPSRRVFFQNLLPTARGAS